MIRRTSVIAIELFAGLLGVVVIALAILFWRLLTGPISLEFATPYIERALSVENPAIDVRVQGTELAWSGWDNVFDIRLRNAAILGSGGKILATLPEVSMGVSPAALLRGVIAPKRLEIHGLNASVERGADGGIVLGFFAGEDSAADTEFVNQLPGYLEKLTQPGDPGSAFGYLRSVRMTGVDLEFFDRPRDANWVAPDADIELIREDELLEIVASTNLDFEGRSTYLTAHLVFGRDRPTVDLAFDFERLVAADFARRIPEFGPLARLTVPISGQFRVLAQQDGRLNSVAFDLKSESGSAAGNVIVDGRRGLDLTARLAGVEAPLVTGVFPEIARVLTFDAALDAGLSGNLGPDGTIRRLEFDLESGAGTLGLVGKLAAPVEFDRFAAKGAIERDFSVARISRAELEIGDIALSGSLSAHRLGDVYRARIDAGLRNLPMKVLDRYWPQGMGTPARSWTTANIRAGVVEDGHLGLVMQLPVDGMGDAEVRSLSGGLKYRGLEVAYFEGLPEATGVEGTASFGKDRFDLDVTGGKVRDVELEHGIINMTRLDTDSEAIAVDLLLRGPLNTALSVMDHDPLRYISALGLDPDAIGGEMAMRLGLRFPLRSDVTTAEVEVGASANLQGLRMSPGPFGREIENGDLELALSGGTMKVGGNVELDGVPVSVDWHEEFNPGTPFRSRYIVSGKVDRAAMTRLGLPESRFIAGSAEMNVILTQFGDGRSEVLAGADLASAILSVPEVGWIKPVGRPASMTLEVSVDPNGHPTVERVAATAADLDLEAKVAFDPAEPARWKADFAKLVLGRSELHGVLRRSGPDSYAISLGGPRLDLEPSLLGTQPEAREVPAKTPGTGTTLSIELNVAALRLGPKSGFGRTVAEARYLGEELTFLSLHSAVGDSGLIRIDYAPDEGGYRFDVHSDDAGRALRSLGWSDKLEGGTLSVTGRRSSPGAPLRGAFKLADYKVTRAPALARLLQVASLTGIFAAFGQRGLDFVSFDGNFEYRGGRLWIDQSRTFGSSLGITVEGRLDLETDTADLKGTVVPAYTVNRVLGQIPILGPLLTGGEEEGVFAATYAVTGPIEDPDISVNPLSALAPGFLRKLFDGITGGSAPPPPAIPKSAR